MKPIFVFGSKTMPTCELNTTDSFVTNAVNLCLMLAGKFDVRLVGMEGSEVPGVETWEWGKALGWLCSHHDQAVVCVTGPDHLEDAIQLPQTLCEPTRGYMSPVFTPHIAFPSWAWLHFHVGYYQAPDGWQNWRMIPHAIVPERFIYREKKKDFVLFLGRLNHGKGLDIAIEACHLADQKLVVAGLWQGDESAALLKNAGRQVEYVGFADYHLRRELLADAKALIYPTRVLEPFGYTVLEANASGTPALVTDWGAFTETIKHGFNGFCCRETQGISNFLRELALPESKACRAWVRSNYSIDQFGAKFFDYLKALTI
ncbi:MAG: glycosyltransferase [Planctomycetes bacterium]|nr:glycosyltransferase [Planctomycetota bacterium]